MTKRGPLLRAAVLLAVVGALSCGDDTTAPPPAPPPPPPDPSRPSTLSISPDAAELNALGQTIQLTATVRDQYGAVMAGAAVGWASSDASVATVDTSGLVRAAGDGTATITATSGEASASASVTVEQQVSEVTVSPATALLPAVGDTVRLAATATDANGHAVPGAAFTWGSSDDAVATVDTSGLVRAAGDGTATITATSGEASGSGSITVTQQVTAVTVSPPAATLPPGDTLRFEARATDANGYAVAGAVITWGSSDDAVATVDASGLVRAVRNGTATITAASGATSGSASVTVKQLSERDVLVALYEATGGTAWVRNDNWLTDAPLGDWHGVQVEDGRVAHLILSANNLTGRIPLELGRLSNLVSLGLDNNSLTGPIAPQLGRLSHLVFLALGGNDLTGPVPPQLGNLSSLASLYIGHNDLTGSIPSGFLQLERLSAFGFEENAGLCAPGTADFVDWANGVDDYAGPFCNRAEIPLLETLYEATGGENWTNSHGWLGDGAVEGWYGIRADSLGFVTALDLNRNGLAGRVPSTLAGLERMTSLSIGGNALEGRLPLSLVALPLREFRYGNTDLCTPPDQFFRAWLSSIASHHGTDVECARLRDRDILALLYHETGGPDWINNANWLSDAPLASWHGVRVEDGRVVRLDLAGNALTGELPAELGSLERLRFLNLDANDVGGSIPAELGQLSHLEWLAAAFNDLTGPIPPELGELSRLGTLSFPLNNLTGPIPPELGRLSFLRTLDLRQNRLTGSIPPRLGDLSNLRALWLPKNSLTGPIPPELGNLEYLRNLILNDNALTGPIPPALGNLSSLEELDATNNHLTGPIPPEFGRLARLNGLLLGSNALTGALPAELGRLANLELLLLWDNDLTGSLPPEIGNLRALELLGLADNRLAGPIPPEIGNLGALEQVSFANNRLTGALPPELGNLARLQFLDLPNNRLTGALPPEFGDLTSLQELVLTGNAGMTGPLPSSLTTLRRLDALLAGGTGLCTPGDAGFQTWLLRVAKVRVSSCAAASSVYLTQAVQSLEFPVSLVAGEPALLRVFVTASNATGQSIPLVRARFYVEGAEVHVADIEGKSTAIPRDLDEGSLAQSANAEIPAEVVQPGLEMVIEVDPDGTLDAALDVARRVPEAGRLQIDVRAMPRLDLTMIPFLWSTAPDSAIIDMIEGMAADPENHEMLWDTRTLMPVGALDVYAHEPVVSTSNDTYRLLAETELISVMEGGRGHYMGMMSGGGTGPTGLAYNSRRQSFSRPVPLAIAHELGHNFSLSHAPCGNPLGPDPSFPQADGSIGAWGYDFRNGGQLVSPGAFDLLAYCGPHWISDYHFSNALGFRLSDEAGGAAGTATSAGALLLWGGAAAEGAPWLEPAFVIDAPATLPRSGGAYELTGRSAGGTELFSLAFDMPEVADGDGRTSFAFALPVRDGWTDLASITLSGPGGDVSLDGTTNRPMAILRDPRTGQVRGVLRDGPSAVLAASGRAAPGSLGAGLDVFFSRGVPGAAAWRR
ncbi:Ig-like domain-containing protein [Candidatus Palauibacter sp.]|uniref:Ig-like domain-containing protein n=1 Tax=Candidatus Palauibacter sp. TaxID=3101350 RepID=UPI003D140F12